MIATPATTVVPGATLQLKVGRTDAVCNPSRLRGRTVLQPPTQQRPLSGYIFWWSIERHCWCQIGTGSPKRIRPILLDWSNLILAYSCWSHLPPISFFVNFINLSASIDFSFLK